jgi:hypothetical protein
MTFLSGSWRMKDARHAVRLNAFNESLGIDA